MRSLMPLAAFAVASCAPQPPAPPNMAFAQELAGHVAGPQQTCVSTSPDQNLRVVDSRTVAYGWGRTIYVNQLAAECPSLSPYNTLIVEASAGQYCRGDRVRALEPGGIIPGPSCNLGNWVTYREP
ncbi:MAG: hypothetical protein V4513_09335 [Pseudomonadota bacterium]